MKRKKQNLSAMEVQKFPCETCPFEGKDPISLSSDSYGKYIDNLVQGKGQHLCHSSYNNKICRGGRNIQLKVFYALKLIKEPTDEAFDIEMQKALS